jgi:hypothetical protein
VGRGRALTAARGRDAPPELAVGEEIDHLRPEGPATLLRDPATNEESSIPTADIESIAASPVSPMPAAYDTLLSESDFFDVITYLRATP